MCSAHMIHGGAPEETERLFNDYVDSAPLCFHL